MCLRVPFSTKHLVDGGGGEGWQRGGSRILFANIHGVVSFLRWKFGMKTSRQVQREADAERQRDTLLALKSG